MSKNKRGYLLSEALVCVAICSVLCLWSTALMQITMKKEEIMKNFEEEINHSWEEIYASISPCALCTIEDSTEEIEEEY